MRSSTVLITGASGLVGTDLASRLESKLGKKNVICTDLLSPVSPASRTFSVLDVRNRDALEKLIQKYSPSCVYHLAGLLSAGGERDPHLAWDTNVGGLKNVLDLSRQYGFQVFWPSSIAAFGATTPRRATPQHTVLEPNTMYGVTKVAGELLCQYYHHKYHVDVRSLRYPGLIAWKAPPGDGTTEYAVHIFYSALQGNHYTCYLSRDTVLPMMYIDDAVSGTIALMSAPASAITVRTGYNFSALSFSPQQLAAEIARVRPGFTCDYQPDFHQDIADSWPQEIDDSQARRDWGWRHQVDLPALVQIMLDNLPSRIS